MATDGEAMEQGVQATCSTQAVTEPVLGKAGLYGTKGVTEWGVTVPMLTFPSSFLPGWLSPLSASKCAGVRSAGHVPEAGRALHPHPTGSSWWVPCPSPALWCLQPAWHCLTLVPCRGGAVHYLCCGCGHRDLLLPVRGHRLREEHFHRWLHHVHGSAGATVAQHSSGLPGHR